MKYYVNCQVAEDGCGDEKHPFRTISEAADRALPGDEVLVYPGIYRENVNSFYTIILKNKFKLLQNLIPIL